MADSSRFNMPCFPPPPYIQVECTVPRDDMIILLLSQYITCAVTLPCILGFISQTIWESLASNQIQEIEAGSTPAADSRTSITTV